MGLPSAMPKFQALSPLIKRERAQIFAIKFESIVEPDVGRVFCKQAGANRLAV